MPALHSRKSSTSWDIVAYHCIAVNQTLAHHSNPNGLWEAVLLV